ncbi:hypothetical protein [Mycoplana rhizolycopersici]|uniref:Uncharacterized protein n=1 Tax=Mycoplana rhizolycopersici TaxID=2746702 RepID=A0ABX2QEM0_9HYPH|nr:hypothetical protein [Rhizobium rhizolycopersici]NVP56182.1 hypothetical protein [Rhizobium rhizolycopersici]
MNVMPLQDPHPDAEEHSIPAAPVSGLTADTSAISAKTGAAASASPQARVPAAEVWRLLHSS